MGDELDYAHRLLGETREEVSRADHKASILLGGATVSIGLLASALAAEGGWKPSDLSEGWQPAFWIGVLLAGVGVALLSAAVFPRTAVRSHRQPRTRDPNPGRADYFGDLAQATTEAEASERVRRSAEDEVGRTVRQAWHLSRVVGRKYAFTRGAFWSLGAASILILGSLVLG